MKEWMDKLRRRHNFLKPMFQITKRCYKQLLRRTQQSLHHQCLGCSGWQAEVETLTPSPIVQHPHKAYSPTMARRRFNAFRESWDGGGGGGGSAGGGGGMTVRGSVMRGQDYQPTKYGLVTEEMYRSYSQHPNYEAVGYRYPTGESPHASPAMVRRMLNRAPAENRNSFPDTARTLQLFEDYYDGYGSSSTAGGSTSGYGSGGGGAYEYPSNMRSLPHRKSSEFHDGSVAQKQPRSILRTSQSQAQIQAGFQSHPTLTSSSSSPAFGGQAEMVGVPAGAKQSVGDLRQWQQLHQEELMHQHLETQALYGKQSAAVDTSVRPLGLKEEDPSRWDPVRRAADNIIREKNMIIEKLRQRVLELEEDLKLTDNKLRHTLLATEDKADLVQQKVKELQYKCASLKSDLAETRTKKNGEINSLEEQLGASEHEVELVKTQLKLKEADYDSLVAKLQSKEKEVEGWGQRFQEMKASHQQLRLKLDSLERYLSDLPTAEETVHNTQEILRLKEEHTQNKFRADDLEQKLSATRKQLSARELRVKELESSHSLQQQHMKELEKELQRVRQEDSAAQNLFRCEQELRDSQHEKERAIIDLEKAKKLLETTHRRLRQTEARLQAEITELKQRLEQEEESVGLLRGEIMEKERQNEKSGRLIKELRGQIQDLTEQNLILHEHTAQTDQLATDEGARLQRRLVTEIGLCFSQLQSLVHVCQQRVRGEDPNMSVLLGFRDAMSDSSEEDLQAGGSASGKAKEAKQQSLQHWLNKVADLRKEVEQLRCSLSDHYAEYMATNMQCATQ